MVTAWVKQGNKQCSLQKMHRPFAERCAHSMHGSSLPMFWFSTMAEMSLAFSSSI